MTRSEAELTADDANAELARGVVTLFRSDALSRLRVIPPGESRRREIIPNPGMTPFGVPRCPRLVHGHAIHLVCPWFDFCGTDWDWKQSGA